MRGQLLQGQFAAGVVEVLEPVEAVAAVAHHLAGLADVAELPGKLQQADLGADDLLFLGLYLGTPSSRRSRALHNPDRSAPGFGSRFSLMTPHVRLSPSYFKWGAGDGDAEVGHVLAKSDSAMPPGAWTWRNIIRSSPSVAP